MAKLPMLQLPGKVDASNQLVVVAQAVSGTPKGGSALGNLQGVVDANNQLKVTFG